MQRSSDELFSTRQAALLLGVGTSTIKRWADSGVLPCVKTAGHHRRFRKEELQRLRGHGLTNATSASSNFDSDRWLAMLGDEDMSHDAVCAALWGSRTQVGSWWELADHLGDVLNRIGMAWQAGRMSIVEEHQASSRLARALATCAEQTFIASHSPKALLATAEGDEHTRGLSLLEVCLREAGVHCVWIGAPTPVNALLEHLHSEPVNMVCVSASSYSQGAEILAHQATTLLHACGQADIALALGGRGAWPKALHGTHYFRNFAEFGPFLTSWRQSLPP